jgi:hypothetical protein
VGKLISKRFVVVVVVVVVVFAIAIAAAASAAAAVADDSLSAELTNPVATYSTGFAYVSLSSSHELQRPMSFRSEQSLSHSRNFSPFTKSDGFLLLSQQPVTSSCTMLNHFTLSHPIVTSLIFSFDLGFLSRLLPLSLETEVFQYNNQRDAQ